MVEKTLNDLFFAQLKDIYFAERKIVEPCRRW
jgi:ferritin-like metal-binding protein YciE